MAGNDANTKLLLHMNAGEGVTTFTDSSVAAPTHIISEFGNAEQDTGVVKAGWGLSSGLFDGTGDYLSTPDHADWDVFGSLTDNQTVDFQIYPTETIGNNEIIINQSDGSMQWSFRRTAAGELWAYAWTPTGIFDYLGYLYSYGYQLPSNTWSHYAAVKVGSKLGLYLNGAQVAFSNVWLTVISTGVLTVGAGIAGATPFQGNVDEVRVQADNYFSADPNSFPMAPALIYGEGTDGDTTVANDGYSGAVTLTNATLEDSGPPKFNATTSLYFNGTTAYATVVDTSGTDYDVIGLATDSWTLDLWVKHTDHVSTEEYLNQWEDSSNEWEFRHGDGSGLLFRASSGGGTIINTGAGGEITDTNWHHAAVVKAGANYGCYLDGVQVNHTNDSSTATFTGSLQIGRNGAGSAYFDGYLEQVQITRANKFGVVPAVVRMDMEGSDGATSYTANTGQVVTFINQAQIDTAQFKFGASSCLFDGADDEITIPDGDETDFGAGDWTIEVQVRFNSLTGNQNFGGGQTTGASNNWALYKPSYNAIAMEWTDGGTPRFSYATSGFSFATDTWYHVAVVRGGDNFYIFVNGVAQTLTTVVTIAGKTLGNISSVLRIGDLPSDMNFNGWLDEYKIYKGWAKYTEDFTAPTDTLDLTLPTAILTQDTITAPTEEYAPPAVGYSQAIVIA